MQRYPYDIGYDRMQVREDTILFAVDYAIDTLNLNHTPWPGLVKMNKDLEVLERQVYPDTVFGKSGGLLALAKTTDGRQTGYRFVIDRNECSRRTGTPIYGQKFSLDGRNEHYPLYGTFPFNNDMVLDGDRLLLTGHAAYTVLDTNFNVIVDERRWLDYDEYPFLNSGFIGGYPSRGMIINGVYYFFLTGVCQDRSPQNCLIGQKWNDITLLKERVYFQSCQSTTETTANWLRLKVARHMYTMGTKLFIR